MKIFFGTTTARWLEYKNLYLDVRNYLKESGCVILFDWIEDVLGHYNNPKVKERNITTIYQNVTKAIDEADAVVIEYTIPNFSSSHQIDYALLKRKPVLVMRLSKDNSRYKDSFLEAIESEFLTVREYKISEYKKVIDEFIGFAKLEPGQKRYNIVLGKKHKYYLDWASNKYKKSRSEIIKELLEERMKSDDLYKKYFLSID